MQDCADAHLSETEVTLRKKVENHKAHGSAKAAVAIIFKGKHR